METTKVSWIVVVIMLMCVSVFAIGGYKITKAEQTIAEIIDAQSPLIFAFENPGPPEGPAVVQFVVTCELNEKGTQYDCKTTSPSRPTVTPVPPTPTGPMCPGCR